MDKTFEKTLLDMWYKSDKKVKRFKRKMKRRARKAFIRFICNPYVSAFIVVLIYLLINYLDK